MTDDFQIQRVILLQASGHLFWSKVIVYHAFICHICQMLNVDLWDMLNNFCFHVYAQKSLFINLQNLQNCKTCKLANLQNLQIDPWDMLNNFCFHVYAQMSLIIGENGNYLFFDISSTLPCECQIVRKLR